MPQVALVIAYDGTAFHGWQKQLVLPAMLEDAGFKGRLLEPGAPAGPDGRVALRTVQHVVERAVSRVCNQPVRLTGASRTDAGVHAAAQVASFERAPGMAGPPLERMADALTSILPEDVLVRSAREVPDGFDPIGGCARKGYRYSLHVDRTRPLWDRRYVHHVHVALDVGAMRDAAARLVGVHDFAAFTNVGGERETTVRTVLACDVVERGPSRLALDVSGDGFLYNMVRIIAGTLVDVGRGVLTPGDVSRAVETGDRRSAGPTLPAPGLRLEWMEHPLADGTLMRSPEGAAAGGETGSGAGG